MKRKYWVLYEIADTWAGAGLFVLLLGDWKLVSDLWLMPISDYNEFVKLINET